jgi:y4mF family transcriptional regulator
MDNTVTPLRQFLKEKRRQTRLTQLELAAKAGVGLRFLREMEQGKQTLRMDKVNQVLMMFGAELGPVPINREKLLNEDR